MYSTQTVLEGRLAGATQNLDSIPCPRRSRDEAGASPTIQLLTLRPHAYFEQLQLRDPPCFGYCFLTVHSLNVEAAHHNDNRERVPCTIFNVRGDDSRLACVLTLDGHHYSTVASNLAPFGIPSVVSSVSLSKTALFERPPARGLSVRLDGKGYALCNCISPSTGQPESRSVSAVPNTLVVARY